MNLNSGRYKWWLAAMAAAWAMPAWVQACPVCFGAPEDPITQSIGWGILFLLGVVGAVLGTIAVFFVYIIRREAAMNETKSVTGLSVATGKV